MMPSARMVLAPRVARSAAAQLELEQQFFGRLRLSNGTYKTTRSGRLRNVDAVLCDLLEGQSPPLSVLDTAVSSGVTTLELLEALAARGWTPRMVATDLYLRGRLVAIPLGDLLFDDSGHLLQVAVVGFAKPRPHAPDDSLPRRVLQGIFHLVERVAASTRVVQRGQEVALVSRLLSTASSVELVRHDLLLPREEWTGQFALVRAANILNLDYFPPDLIQTMARHLLSYLRRGSGLLCVCRTTEDGANHGTVWRVETDGTPAIVASFGQGSEVANLVEAATGAQAEVS